MRGYCILIAKASQKEKLKVDCVRELAISESIIDRSLVCDI